MTATRSSAVGPPRRPVRAALVGVACVLAATVLGCSSGEPPAAAPPATGAGDGTAPPATAAPPTTWPLTGLPVEDPAAPVERRALVVKIDNVDQYSRPQAGINQADLVYEEKIEGPISRFAAVFHSHDVEVLGPVRSGRSTDVAIVGSLAVPLYAFSGANAVFLDQLRAAPLIDVGYDAQPGAYERVRGRPAPDDLFTATGRLWALAPGDGSPPPPQLRYRAAGDPPPAGAVPVRSLAYSFGGGPVGQPVTMTWDETVGGWTRTQKGTPHVDADGVPIAPANVIVQFVPYCDTGLVDTSGTEVPEALLVGEGPAWVLTGGTGLVGRWSKPTEAAATTYTGPDGSPVALGPGQTWIALVPEGGDAAATRADGTPLR